MRQLLTLVLLVFLTACANKQPGPEKKTEPSTSVPVFDGKRAFAYLVTQTDFGPRVANTPAHEKCLTYLYSELKQFADTVWLQPFTHKGYEGTFLRFTNVIASFNPANGRTSRRIILCAHWDSRPWADQDTLAKNRAKPVPGANDGASGVAILLEIARQMKTTPPPIGVDVVFFDGEDYGRSRDLDNFLLGSRYFAKNKPAGFNPDFGILLDMVGDAQLEIPKEANSLQFAPDVVDLIWSTARGLGITTFIDAPGETVYDDHLPLNEAGIRTIDLIDFNYPDESNRYWHTVEDTPDKCSPESLEDVGSVLLHVLYHLR